MIFLALCRTSSWSTDKCYCICTLLSGCPTYLETFLSGHRTAISFSY